MKKLLTIISCLMMAALAFGQWDVVKGPLDIDSPGDAVALNATTVLALYGDMVKKSTDFGASWTDIMLPEGVSLTAIDAANENVAYACGDDGFVFKTIDGGDNWTQVGDTANYKIDMDVIDVLDENTVFIGGGYTVTKSPRVYSGVFFKTTDGGANWDTTVVCDEILDGGIAFTDANNGVVFDDGTSGIIRTTHDGGANWTEYPVTLPFGVNYKRMYTASAVPGTSTILVGGYHNIVWLSTDNGDTWTCANPYDISYGFDRMNGLKAFDTDNWLAFSSGSEILKTTDAGTTWDTLRIGSGQSYKAQAFSSMTNGIIWAGYGQEFSTTDGSTFVPLNEWPGISFYSIAIPEKGKILVTATSGGEITLSDNDGASWTYPSNAETGAPSSIFASVALDANTMLIGGSNGYIAKSVDAGATWTKIDNPMAQESNKSIYTLYQAPNGDVYAAGSSAWLLKSTDQGENWEQIPVSSSMTIYGMTVFSNGKAFLGGNSGKWCMSASTALDSFYQVTEMGTMNVRQPKERNGVILVPANDFIYRMRDTYDSLEVVFEIPNKDDAYALEWVSDDVAFFAGSKGAIYRTEDAGETWEQEMSAADDYLYDLKYDGEKLWTAGRYGLIMSRKYEEVKADFTEEFSDGTPDLTWVENTANANPGGLNLTVAADSAGMTNVGIYADDANTGMLYVDTGKKLKNYEVSVDIYIEKEYSADQPYYPGLLIKADPEATKYYRFVYRNATSSMGALKFQGYDGSWHGSKQWNAGVDFDTLETGFHNFKAQVVDNKFWLYIDGELLPGCPISQEDNPVLTAGYPGIYVYNATDGKVVFDNFKVNVYSFIDYHVTANVDMGIMVRRGDFDPASSALDIIGTFDGWTGTPMTDTDADTVYTASLGWHDAGTTIEFKCRRNGAWDNTEEFPSGGANRTYLVTEEENQVIPTFLYGDITEVAIDGVPEQYELSQNYPNPFNPATTIKFQIPATEMVTMNIFDLKGRKVAELFNTQMDAGYYNVTFDASALPSGMYIYRLTAGEFRDVKKMTLLK